LKSIHHGVFSTKKRRFSVRVRGRVTKILTLLGLFPAGVFCVLDTLCVVNLKDGIFNEEKPPARTPMFWPTLPLLTKILNVLPTSSICRGRTLRAVCASLEGAETGRRSPVGGVVLHLDHRTANQFLRAQMAV